MNQQPALLQIRCREPLIGDQEGEEEARGVEAIATPTDSDDKRKGSPAASPEMITSLTNTAVDDRVLGPKKKVKMSKSLAEGMQTEMAPILTAPSSRVLESQKSLPRATSPWDLHPQLLHQQLLHHEAFSRQSPAHQARSHFLTQPTLSQQGPLASPSLPMLPHHNQNARGVPPLAFCLYEESLASLQQLQPASPVSLPPIVHYPHAANVNKNNKRTRRNDPPVPLSVSTADGGPPVGFVHFTDQDVKLVDDYMSVVAFFESDDEDTDDDYDYDDITTRCSASSSFFSDDDDFNCESKVVVVFEEFGTIRCEEEVRCLRHSSVTPTPEAESDTS